MKKPAVDYRHFRLSRINEPQYRHMYYLLIWVFYLVMYELTERLIRPEDCHVVHCRLDDLVPFVEFFVVAYVYWFVYVFYALAYYFMYDPESFRKLSKFIFITQIGAMAAYILFPSIQLLRPQVFPRHNAFTWALSIIYGIDTPTGVCPSLHVAYSVGVASVVCKNKSAPRRMKVVAVVASVIISLSTAFVKQHSFVDIFCALPLALAAELIVYLKPYYLPKIRRARLRAL